MIVDERMRTYINSLDMGNTPFLEELEQYAIRERVPIIRREMQSFIKMFLAVNRPKRILEVGTAIGFSTLLMCEYGQPDMHITLLEGDAGQILKALEDSFDMIFMDAAKGQYINWLPDVMRLMKNGGVLISDNVLQEGDIIESHYLVERRNRTIYKRMREYLYELKHNPSLITSIIPLGDGVTVSVKQE